METTEEWRDIAGYEGLYKVSSLGRVLSTGCVRPGSLRDYKISERILRARNNPVSGYPVICLHDAPRPPKSCNVHTLVAVAFHGPCPEGMECCHNDGDPTNAAASNLRWDTHMSNTADTVKHGRSTFGEKNPSARLKEKDVREMLIMLANGKRQKEVRAAFGFIVSKCHMSMIANRKLWGHITI